MKHRIAPLALGILVAGLSLSAPSARAARVSGAGGHPGRNFGLGIVLGEPSGLSAKYFLGSREALDFGLAFSFNDFFLIFSDYLYHFPGAFSTQSRFVNQITPYLGIGGVFFASTKSNRTDRKFFTEDGTVGLGLRLPFGLEWSPGSPPLGVFVELVPGLGIVPSTFGFLEGGIGIRYYF